MTKKLTEIDKFINAFKMNTWKYRSHESYDLDEEKKKIEKLKSFLKYGVDIDSKAKQCGTTALIYCVQHNEVGVVKFLLQHGANIEAQNKLGYTAIRYCKNVEMVDLLVQYKANINATFKDGKSILHVFETYQSSWSVEEAQSQVNKYRAYIKYGANKNAVDNAGNTPLHHLANIYEPHSLFVDFFVEEFIHLIDNKNNKNWTSFHICSYHTKSIYMLEKLLLVGANINIPGPSGRNPVDDCFLRGNFEECKLLMLYGANICKLVDMKREKIYGSRIALYGKYDKKVYVTIGESVDSFNEIYQERMRKERELLRDIDYWELSRWRDLGPWIQFLWSYYLSNESEIKDFIRLFKLQYPSPKRFFWQEEDRNTSLVHRRYLSLRYLEKTLQITPIKNLIASFLN